MASFGYALVEMKRGGAVARVSWPAQFNMQIRIMLPGAPGNSMTQPFFVIEFEVGAKYPWFPSMDEMLADDWNLVRKSSLILPPQANVN